MGVLATWRHKFGSLAVSEHLNPLESGSSGFNARRQLSIAALIIFSNSIRKSRFVLEITIRELFAGHEKTVRLRQ
jgi:hypothetical protein